MYPTTNPWQTPSPTYVPPNNGTNTSYQGSTGVVIPSNNSTNTSYPGSQGVVIPNQTNTPQAPQGPQDPNSMSETARNAWAIGNGYTGWNNYLDNKAASQGTGDAGIQSAIDAAYAPAMDAYNQNTAMLGTAKTAAEAKAEADFQANQGLLGTQKTSALNTIGTQARAGEVRKEDAMAQARRLFQELQQTNKQRFGRSTSAGGAASDIQGAELQRQFGTTGRSYNDFTQQIDQAKKTVDEQFNQGQLQLNQSKQTALAQIQSDFTNSIMQINNMRASTEQQKGMARLQALNDLRNQALQLNQQATQFEQQLTAMREQQRLNIEAYQKTSGTATGNAGSAYSQFNTQANQPSNFSQVGSFSGPTYSQQQQTNQIGQVNSNQTQKSWLDQLLGR